MTQKAEVQGRIVLGSGRSGTTWVQDCLAEANSLRPIFEPLHQGESELGQRFAYRLLMPGEVHAELERYFRDLAAGRVRSLWVDYRARGQLLLPQLSRLGTIAGLRGWLWRWKKYLSNRRELHGATRRPETLIKCIRANLMAGWLSRSMGFKTVLLVRHPCASVESQYRSGSVWDPEAAAHRYRSDTSLHEASNGIYLPLLNSRLTRLQALILNWVIENQGPVARASTEGYTVIYYEHLREQPSVAWPNICEALGLADTPGEQLIKVPSQQSYGKNTRSVLSARQPRWRQVLGAEQLSEIQAILDATGCSLYDVSNDYPLKLLPPIF